MAKRSQRFIDEAAAQSLVRYGPELSVLKALMSEAGQTYRRSLHQAQAGALGVQGAVPHALSQLKDIYSGDAGQAFGGLGYKLASQSAVERGLSAAETAQTQRQAAVTALRGDQGKIAARRSDIAQEIGAFTTATAGTLADKAAQRDLTNRVSLRADATRKSEGAANRANAVKVAKIRKKDSPTRTASAAKQFEKKYGVKPLSREQHNSLRSKVDSTGAVVKDQIAKGSSRSRIAGLLVNGRPAIKGKSSSGADVSLPAISKTDPFVASMALDIAFNGRLSGKNAAEAHRRGYSVTGLGLPGTTAAARQKAQEERKRKAAAKRRTTNALANAFGPFGNA